MTPPTVVLVLRETNSQRRTFVRFLVALLWSETLDGGRGLAGALALRSHEVVSENHATLRWAIAHGRRAIGGRGLLRRRNAVQPDATRPRWRSRRDWNVLVRRAGLALCGDDSRRE